ncbi:unnamed protein product [Paramecium primaurelia]|uniref:MORN repeat protein n=1 Tax=Paramecium primaurelia TaxID=5886 RepID=A0A8S1NWJ4_PARPR|nr:unnamed protein product [Paramecium primaurelia]
MLSENQQTQFCLENLKDQKVNKDYQVKKWDEKKKKIVKVKIQITFTQDNQMIYQQEGVILRQEFNQDDFRDQEILTDMEQIQFLQWQGEYGPNQKKQGKWIAIWKGEMIEEVGGYYENGLKLGQWKQPSKSYWSQAQLYESGEYFLDQKLGRWNYIYDNQIIGGGSYDQAGGQNKIGYWIDYDDRFSNYRQVAHNGQYENGKKVGRWEIEYRYDNNYPFSKIGGGLYKDGLKHGQWTDLDEDFSEEKQVTHNGEYQNEIKVGRWDIEYRLNSEKLFTKIGGGQYVDGVKNSKWIELDEEFQNAKQVVLNGEYKNGKKMGRWDIEYRSYKIIIQIGNSGGGQYDDGVKIGNWIDLDEEFKYLKQIIHNGEYQNGKKVGVWVEMKRVWYLMEEGFKKVNEIKYDI